MANRKKRQGAIGGAITPALPGAQAGGGVPQTFNQFIDSATPAAGTTPTPQLGASNPFTAPTPTATPDPATSGPRDNGSPRQGPPTPTLPGGATPPNPVGMYDPALYGDFVRHWYAMQNAKIRGDDPANFGAGSMRTMAF